VGLVLLLFKLAALFGDGLLLCLLSAWIVKLVQRLLGLCECCWRFRQCIGALRPLVSLVACLVDLRGQLLSPRWQWQGSDVPVDLVSFRVHAITRLLQSPALIS